MGTGDDAGGVGDRITSAYYTIICYTVRVSAGTDGVLHQAGNSMLVNGPPSHAGPSPSAPAPLLGAGAGLFRFRICVMR